MFPVHNPSKDPRQHVLEKAGERDLDDVEEMEAARLARLRAYHAMTMSERLERTHQLCAQLSKLRPIEPR
jgi:hypothetical protein